MRFFNKSEKQITISSETILKTIALTLAAFFLLRFVSSVSHQLTLIGVAAFLAMALNPAVTWLTRNLKSKSRVRATGVAYIIVLTVLIGFLGLVLPPLVRQTTDFAKDLPQTIEDFQQQDSAIARFTRQYDLEQQLNNAAREFSDNFSDASGPLISTASRAVGTLISIVTVLILTFMLLVEGPLWYQRALALYDDDKRKRYDQLAQRMYKVVTGYVNGQVLIAAIAAFFAMIGLMIASTITDASINVVAMAGIVFIFGLIPLIGNTLAAVLVVMFSLFESSTLAIIMAIFFVLYQQIENATLQPYIQSRTNQLTPLIVFVAAILGAGFGGLLGALAAIPIAGCIRILVEDHYGVAPETTVDKSKL